MAFGPFEDDHTQVGGVKGNFNEDEDPPANAPRNPPSNRTPKDEEDERQFTEAANAQNQPPVTHDSPWKLHFPAWRTIVLGGSGGIYKDTHTHLES